MSRDSVPTAARNRCVIIATAKQNLYHRAEIAQPDGDQSIRAHGGPPILSRTPRTIRERGKPSVAGLFSPNQKTCNRDVCCQKNQVLYVCIAEGKRKERHKPRLFLPRSPSLPEARDAFELRSMPIGQQCRMGNEDLPSSSLAGGDESAENADVANKGLATDDPAGRPGRSQTAPLDPRAPFIQPVENRLGTGGQSG